LIVEEQGRRKKENRTEKKRGKKKKKTELVEDGLEGRECRVKKKKAQTGNKTKGSEWESSRTRPRIRGGKRERRQEEELDQVVSD